MSYRFVLKVDSGPCLNCNFSFLKWHDAPDDKQNGKPT